MKETKRINIQAHNNEEMIQKINIALKMEGYDNVVPEDAIKKLRERIANNKDYPNPDNTDLSYQIPSLPFYTTPFYVLHQDEDIICVIMNTYYGLQTDIVLMNIKEDVICGFRKSKYINCTYHMKYTFFTFIPNQKELGDNIGREAYDIKRLVVTKEHLKQSIEKIKRKNTKHNEKTEKKEKRIEHFNNYSKIKTSCSAYRDSKRVVDRNKFITYWKDGDITTIIAPVNWNKIVEIRHSAVETATKENDWFSDWKKHRDFLFKVFVYNRTSKTTQKGEFHFAVDGNKLMLNGKHFNLKTKDDFISQITWRPSELLSQPLDEFLVVNDKDSKKTWQIWISDDDRKKNQISFNMDNKTVSMFGETYKINSEKRRDLLSLTNQPHKRTDRDKRDIYEIALKLKEILPITMDEIVEKINLTRMVNAL